MLAASCHLELELPPVQDEHHHQASVSARRFPQLSSPRSSSFRRQGCERVGARHHPSVAASAPAPLVLPSSSHCREFVLSPPSVPSPLCRSPPAQVPPLPPALLASAGGPQSPRATGRGESNGFPCLSPIRKRRLYLPPPSALAVGVDATFQQREPDSPIHQQLRLLGTGSPRQLLADEAPHCQMRSKRTPLSGCGGSRLIMAALSPSV
mmetsp:Transcript_66668/g.168097  ORF Transcript_66668/g.168097 Transcript_66668/m.168097 type:complete len:209 (+) Transcript_66668:108-734(+)